MTSQESQSLDAVNEHSVHVKQRTFSMVLAYDGSRYGGWQRQNNSFAIQQCLEEALEQTLQEPCRTLASGRTDAGVHATGQVVRFRSHTWQHEGFKLVPAINRHLPKDIAVQQVREMKPTFNPMSDSISKTYRYTIRLAKCPDPFDDRVSWYIPRRLDYGLLVESAAYLVGQNDFLSFEALGSPRSSTVRHLSRLEIQKEPARFGEYLYLEFEADGFLYNMVRNITGTLVSIATRGLPAKTAHDIMLAKDRKLCGQNAPACGLCLVSVNYPNEVYLD